MGFASGDVGGQGFVEKVRLNAAWRFARSAEPNPSPVCELQGELFDLDVTPANLLARLRLKLAEAMFDPRQEVCCGG